MTRKPPGREVVRETGRLRLRPRGARRIPEETEPTAWSGEPRGACARRGHTGAGPRVSGVTSRRGRVEAVDQTDQFEVERPRLVGIASRVLGDHAEAQDVVQQAWLRLHGTDAEIDSLPAWLTTVTTRLCLDRLRSRTPVPVDDVGPGEILNDPADDVALADTIGLALHVVL